MRVAVLGELAEFRHVAEHQPGRARQRAHDLEAGAHRAGIGIVGIVDDPAVARAGLELQAARHRTKIREAERDFIEGCACRGGRCRRAERVADIVRTARLERDRALPERALEQKARDELAALDGERRALRGEIRLRVHPERDDAARRRDAAPVGGVGIVGIDDGRRAGVEAGHHLALALRDAVEVAEAFEMLGAGVGDQAHRRPRQPHQFRHIADAVRAHLDHGAAVRGLEAHQRHRHADVIVQVAVSRHARSHARENRGDHFLGGGLPVAAADGHDGHVEFAAPCLAQLLQRAQRVWNHDLRQRMWHGLLDHGLLDNGADGAALRRRRDELAAVEIRPAQRDEQRPGRESAAVGGHRAVGTILAGQSAAERRCGVAQRSLHSPTSLFMRPRRIMRPPRDSAALRADR